jgi:hypothetical protein
MLTIAYQHIDTFEKCFPLLAGFKFNDCFPGWEKTSFPKKEPGIGQSP